MTKKTIGYEMFLPAIAAAIRGKEQTDDQLSESEFKQVVAIVYRDTVIQFMKDSWLYRVEIPIDLYQDVKRYDVIPPEGYIVEDIVSFKEHKGLGVTHTTPMSSSQLRS